MKHIEKPTAFEWLMCCLVSCVIGFVLGVVFP